MIYNGIIKGIGEDGEEVTIKINDVIITGFVNCGVEKNIGDICDFKIQLYDDLEMKEIAENKKEIHRIGNSYSYYVRGILDIDALKIHSILDIDLEKEDVYDYSFLDSKYVEIRVQRLDINFNI